MPNGMSFSTISGTGPTRIDVVPVFADFNAYTRAAFLLATAGSISSFAPNSASLEAFQSTQYQLPLVGDFAASTVYDLSADSPPVTLSEAAARARAAASRIPKDMLDLDF